MVDNNKGKTKAAILHELESIKGLLHDEDDIPILQEVIAEETTTPQTAHSNRPMAKQDLDALHKAFQALSSNIHPDQKAPIQNQSATREPGKVEVQQPTRAANVTVQLKQQARHTIAPGQSAPVKQQPSLFGNENLDQDYQNSQAAIPSAKPNGLSPGTGGEKIMLTGDTDIQHNENTDYPTNKSITSQTSRSPLAKASGENPFLPQHIRARLHGNNPPPLFEEPASTPAPQIAPASARKITDDTLPDRKNLVQQVIASLLPQIQLELRQRLQDMTEDELIHLLNQEE